MPDFHPAARWSGFLQGISASVCLLLIGTGAVIATVVPAPWRAPLLAPLLLIPLAALLLLVRGYALHGEVLLVRRLCWTTRLPLGALREARRDPQAGAGSLRLLGNGGLFAFCGWFRSARLGRYRAFVTDWQCAVVLRASAVTVVLSPADPTTFVQALQAAAAPPASQASKPRPRWRQSRR